MMQTDMPGVTWRDRAMDGSARFAMAVSSTASAVFHAVRDFRKLMDFFV